MNKEIYASGIPLEDDAVFGYQERYAEYRYKPSRVTGKFAPTSTTPLDAWHLSEEFPGPQAPPLNESFINDNPPRIVTGKQHHLPKEYH